MLCAAVRVHAQEPIQASVDRASSASTSRSRYVLRAEGAVRGEPEIAPLAAQFDILNSIEQPPHRHRQRAGGRGQRVAVPAHAEVRRRLHDSAAAHRRSADRTRSACACWRPTPLRRPPPTSSWSSSRNRTSSTRSRRSCSRCGCTSASATGRATLTAPETTGVEAIVEKLGEDAAYKTTRGGRDFRRPRAALRRVPAASGDADDRPRDVRSHGDPRPRLLARAAFSFRRPRARRCSPPSRRRRRSRAPRGCRRSKSR